MAKRKPKLICDLCNEDMDVVRVIPAAALLPELQTFRCDGCGCFATLEPDELAARRMAAAAARKARTAEQPPAMLEAAE